jgi:hypothetical protein
MKDRAKPRKEVITPRPLSQRERTWVREIMEHNPRWADVDIKGTMVVARCDCETCQTIYFDSPLPQNPSLAGTKGYIGRIEITTVDYFLITVTLDQLDGRIHELDVNPLDLIEPGTRTLADVWEEKTHTVTPMHKVNPI